MKLSSAIFFYTSGNNLPLLATCDVFAAVKLKDIFSGISRDSPCDYLHVM